MQRYTILSELYKCDDGAYVLYSEAQAEIDRLTAEKNLLFDDGIEKGKAALNLVIDFIPQNWEVPLGFNQVVAQAKAALAAKEE